MYTLYYLNKNLQLGTIKTPTLDEPILIPEDLVFCNLRKGINFIKEPHQCIDFTDTERLIMNSEFTDVSLLKEFDYRKQNTYLSPLCQIDAPELNDLIEITGFTGNDLHFKLNDYPLPDYVKLRVSVDGVTYALPKFVSVGSVDEEDDYIANVVDAGLKTYVIPACFEAGKLFYKFESNLNVLISNIYEVEPT